MVRFFLLFLLDEADPKGPILYCNSYNRPSGSTSDHVDTDNVDPYEFSQNEIGNMILV